MQVLNVNGSEKVLIDGMYYFDNSQRQLERVGKLKGWVFSDIVKCIYRTLENHPSVRYPAYSSYFRNTDIEMGDSVALVDINHCYLQVANKLGYISDKDYNRILKKYSEIKMDVCAAFTSLFRDVKCTYINDKLKVDRVIECYNYELELVRDNIINYSHGIMANFKGNFYSRNVDGIWIPLSELSNLESYLNDLGLKYKVYSGEYLDYSTLYNRELNIIQHI